jgi:hypothetical protein
MRFSGQISDFAIRSWLIHRTRLTALHFRSTGDTHLRLLPHTPSRADQRFTSLWPSRGAPQQRTCLIGVEFPLPGPQVWTFTSCSLLMPDTLLRRPGAGSPLLHCGQYPSLPRRRCTRAPAGSRAPVGARTTFAAAEAGHAGAAGKGGAWSRRRKAGDTEAPACPASAAACQAGAAPASPASAAADQAGEARGQDALAPCPR